MWCSVCGVVCGVYDGDISEDLRWEMRGRGRGDQSETAAGRQTGQWREKTGDSQSVSEGERWSTFTSTRSQSLTPRPRRDWTLRWTSCWRATTGPLRHLLTSTSYLTVLTEHNTNNWTLQRQEEISMIFNFHLVSDRREWKLWSRIKIFWIGNKERNTCFKIKVLSSY